MNNAVDLLAKQGLLPTSPHLIVADVTAPPPMGRRRPSFEQPIASLPH